MNKFEILSSALEYIEGNLTNGVTPEKCAEACRYSLSNLQKMFRCVFHIGVSDYISRRKLTNAAGELIKTDGSVLDIALKYGYNSHEVFTRAFQRLWGVSPSGFRKTRCFSEIFPRFGEAGQLTDEKGNIIMTSKIRFDVSHLYDFITEHRGCYAVCFDMVGLMRINDTYGHKAGDLAIAECLRRLDENSDENMLPVRIGGDEFVLITDFDKQEDAEEASGRILALNGNTVTYKDIEIPVSMRAGFVRIPKGAIRYNSLFDSFIIAGRPTENAE